MIEEMAQVVACEGRFAWVETQRRSTCNACVAQKGCGTAVLAKVLGQRRTRTRVINDLQAGVGEQVVIGLHEQALLRGALAMYLLPLLCLLAGGLVGAWLAPAWGVESPERFTILLSVLGFATGILWLRYYARGIRHDVRYQPVVLRRERIAPQGSESLISRVE